MSYLAQRGVVGGSGDSRATAATEVFPWLRVALALTTAEKIVL